MDVFFLKHGVLYCRRPDFLRPSHQIGLIVICPACRRARGLRWTCVSCWTAVGRRGSRAGRNVVVVVRVDRAPAVRVHRSRPQHAAPRTNRRRLESSRHQPRNIPTASDTPTTAPQVPLPPLSFTPNSTTVMLFTINYLSLNYPVSSRSRTVLLILSLRLLSPVISLPSYALSDGWKSLNASNAGSFHLSTK